jgi:hypothetical protein
MPVPGAATAADVLSNVFISYARNDDLQEIPGQGTGFVTALWQHLELRFRLNGPPAPRLFRDTREIWDTDQFERVLLDEIERADALLVILSRNWLSRPWCLKELASFEEVWRPKEGDAFRRRIMVVQRQPIDRAALPAALQGQTGLRFFRMDNVIGKPDAEYPFFWRGEPRPEFHDTVDSLVRDLYARPRGLRIHPNPEPAAIAVGSNPAAARPGSYASTVYVAKAAGELEQQYRQLVDALMSRGYAVVPSADAEVPIRGARAFIDEQLKPARASFHLLGTAPGFTPEEGVPIVPLQLERARERAALPANGVPALRRLIWSPKIFADAAGSPAERNASDVLETFDKRIESDKVDDSDLTRFIEFAVQHLERGSATASDPVTPGKGTKLYIYHRADDRDYARRVARALRDAGFKPVLPPIAGEYARQIHLSALQECDAVVLGWASADDSWIRATVREWRDWRALGRNGSFTCRGLLIGPPGDEAKADTIEFPPDDVDVVLDLSAHPDLSAESLAQLIARLRDAAGAGDG